MKLLRFGNILPSIERPIQLHRICLLVVWRPMVCKKIIKIIIIKSKTDTKQVQIVLGHSKVVANITDTPLTTPVSMTFHLARSIS